MELGLSGKVAIITGGSKGIGRAIALALLAEGGSVLIVGRGADALAATADAVAARDRPRLATLAADLTDATAIKRAADYCIERFGRIDILFNNAGSARPGDFLELDDDAWLDDWRLKFFGYVRMARAVLPSMVSNGGGVIINIIGAAALNPRRNYMIGGAANAALNHFTKALADEGAKSGVRVVGINPGPVLTERLLKMRGALAQSSAEMTGDEVLRRMTPLGRVGRPEEVADLALFLVSERAAFIHGANITIDGGYTQGLMG
jgi:NAD(P)-dependent dehydrogenase (short-subunit alcohol dehydrogenase family)